MSGDTDAAATRALDRMMDRLHDVTEEVVEDYVTIKRELVDGETHAWPVPGDEDDDAPDCGHCGSERTFWMSSGDVACNDCVGIMPGEEVEA